MGQDSPLLKAYAETRRRVADYTPVVANFNEAVRPTFHSPKIFNNTRSAEVFMLNDRATDSMRERSASYSIDNEAALLIFKQDTVDGLAW